MASNVTTTPRELPSETATSMSAIALARGPVKSYGTGDVAVRALAGIDVDFARGELTAIMGPSGSGKSTLVHCMAGLEMVTTGTVVTDGLDVGRMNQRQLTKRRRTTLGFTFQGVNLMPSLTAVQNITLPLDVARRPVDRAHCDAIVAAVGLKTRLRTLAAIVGVLAALWPASRAARLPARAHRCRVRLMRAWVALELTAGLAAVVGGALLVAAPDGSLLQLDAAMLGGSPFSDWRLPGILLADLVGGGLLAAGMWDRTGARRASSLGVPR